MTLSRVQFQALERKLASDYLRSEAVPIKTASSSILESYELASKDGGKHLLKLLKDYMSQYSDVAYVGGGYYLDKPWVEFSASSWSGAATDIPVPDFLDRLNPVVYYQTESPPLIRKWTSSAEDRPLVVINVCEPDSNGRVYSSLEVMMPGRQHPAVVEALDEPFIEALKPAGGALRDGCAWQYEPTAKKGQSGLFTFFTSPVHSTLRAAVKNDAGTVQALLEACQSGASVLAMSTLVKRLGLKVGMGSLPPVVGKALSAYNKKNAQCNDAWEEFMPVALSVAGVPNASRFGTHLDSLVYFVYPSGQISKTCFGATTAFRAFDPLKHPVSTPADILSLAKACGKKLPKDLIAEALANAG
jgi:hypothetical protein